MTTVLYQNGRKFTFNQIYFANEFGDSGQASTWLGVYVVSCLCGQLSMRSGDYVVRCLCGQVSMWSGDYVVR